MGRIVLLLLGSRSRVAEKPPALGVNRGMRRVEGSHARPGRAAGLEPEIAHRVSEEEAVLLHGVAAGAGEGLGEAPIVSAVILVEPSQMVVAAVQDLAVERLQL